MIVYFVGLREFTSEQGFDCMLTSYLLCTTIFFSLKVTMGLVKHSKRGLYFNTNVHRFWKSLKWKSLFTSSLISKLTDDSLVLYQSVFLLVCYMLSLQLTVAPVCWIVTCTFYREITCPPYKITPVFIWV